MKRLRYENGDLDVVDRRLLDLVIENARTSNAELARKVGLTAPSVAERLKRLEEAGVIERYAAVVSPAALGLPISAWLRIRPVPGELQRVAKILRDLPEVSECDRITGEDCFLARVHVQSVAHLEGLIDELISYAMTNPSIIQSSPVERRLPRLPAANPSPGGGGRGRAPA